MLKRSLLIAAGVVALLIVGFAAVVALQPNDYRITRQATMGAPAAAVFDQINDFRRWQAWSPWAKLDPAAKNTFEGPAFGPGAIFRWSGNEKVGEGAMTILESKPAELVRLKLEFIRPFPDSCTTEFAFQPTGDQTSVTWTMIGRHQNFLSKAVCFCMNMDKMVGGDFEKALANIKSIVERPADG